MFIFRLSSFFDRIDPYWYCRLIGIKAVYLAIIVFLANTFIKPPLATLIMLFPAVGALIIEMPSINDYKKKDYAYIAYLIVVIITLSLFGAYVYLKEWFIIAAGAWCFILYSALKKRPELFAVVSVFLLLGIISLEAFNTGNFYIILNEVLFILEFSVIVFWAHKLFPNYYHMVWMSACLRMLEDMKAAIDEPDKYDFMAGFKHYLAAKNIEPLLKEPFRKNACELGSKLCTYRYFLIQQLESSSCSDEELLLIKGDITGLLETVKGVTIKSESSDEDEIIGMLSLHREMMRGLVSSWKAL